MKTSVYIHIPFCKSICSYCDFCKVVYNKEWAVKYLKELKKEIEDRYMGESVRTIYIGGGTPSCLSLKEIEYVFDETKTDWDIDDELKDNDWNYLNQRLDDESEFRISKILF